MKGKNSDHYRTISNTIAFLSQNLFEMNRLWIRMQHIGRHENLQYRTNRQEVSLLIGENIVRLSNLKNIDLDKIGRAHV